VQRYPKATISSIVDRIETSVNLADQFAMKGLVANIYFDINNGQNRTGHPLNESTLRDLIEISKIKT